MNTPTFTFRLPAALRERVERAAVDLDITEADVVRRALVRWLNSVEATFAQNQARER